MKIVWIIGDPQYWYKCICADVIDALPKFFLNYLLIFLDLKEQGTFLIRSFYIVIRLCNLYWPNVIKEIFHYIPFDLLIMRKDCLNWNAHWITKVAQTILRYLRQGWGSGIFFHGSGFGSGSAEKKSDSGSDLKSKGRKKYIYVLGR